MTQVTLFAFRLVSFLFFSFLLFSFAASCHKSLCVSACDMTSMSKVASGVSAHHKLSRHRAAFAKPGSCAQSPMINTIAPGLVLVYVPISKFCHTPLSRPRGWVAADPGHDLPVTHSSGPASGSPAKLRRTDSESTSTASI
ncbi:hypothetical protein V8C34DRAFT_267316 [Trichoderma compactum]